MKKFMKYLKRTVITLVAISVVLTSGVLIFGNVRKSMDINALEDYGEKVEVLDSVINMYIVGDENKETIVLLPGYGTVAPKISFDMITDKMKDEYRIVLVEPFGYGLSGQTKRERTVDNMVEEIHLALQSKGIDDFIFMGHSIAGIYMLAYINQYPNEAKAFIGIDTSVPTQPMPGMSTTMLRVADKMGVAALTMTPPFGKAEAPEWVPEKDKDQYSYFMRSTSLNTTMLNEMDNLQTIFESSKIYSLPIDLPVYLFVQENNPEIKNWKELHQEQADSVDHSKIMFIDGDHFLHFEHSDIIVEETKTFLSEMFELGYIKEYNK